MPCLSVFVAKGHHFFSRSITSCLRSWSKQIEEKTLSCLKTSPWSSSQVDRIWLCSKNASIGFAMLPSVWVKAWMILWYSHSALDMSNAVLPTIYGAWFVHVSDSPISVYLACREKATDYDPFFKRLLLEFDFDPDSILLEFKQVTINSVVKLFPNCEQKGIIAIAFECFISIVGRVSLSHGTTPLAACSVDRSSK